MFHPTAIKPDTKRSRLAQFIRWLNAARNGESVPDVEKRALRRLLTHMQSWRECTPNAFLWQQRFPEHWRAIQRSLAKTQLIIVPMQDGWLEAWDWHHGISESKFVDLWRADKLFADFLASFQDRVAVCKRDECGAYFERTPKRTDYCSERCGKTATSRDAKSVARHNERHRKMLRVLEFTRKLRGREPDLDFLNDEESESVWRDQALRNVKGMTNRWLNEAILQRLDAPESFASCERCGEIRGQILDVLKRKARA
jgi:hypothetical protein